MLNTCTVAYTSNPSSTIVISENIIGSRDDDDDDDVAAAAVVLCVVVVGGGGVEDDGADEDDGVGVVVGWLSQVHTRARAPSSSSDVISAIVAKLKKL